MKKEVRARLENVFKYPFFESVGGPLPANVTKIDRWQTALERREFHKWENCKLMARNALQELSEKRNWKRSEAWNPLVRELRPLIALFVDDLLSRTAVPREFSKKVNDQLAWDIMAICIEYEYMDIVEPFFSIPILEPWYAAGHFPCGWDGEEFPDNWDGVIRSGRLMVF